MHINSSGTSLKSGFNQLSLQTPPENTSSAPRSNEFKNTTTTPTTPESLKLNSDCLRNILNFLSIKDAHSLNLVSKEQNIEVNQILNKTHSQKILPKNIRIPFGGITHTLQGINMQIEAKEEAPSTLRVVNDAGHWDAAFIIHCLDKNKSKEGYTNNKRMFLVYAAELGDMTLLKSLKDDFRLTANDARANDNKALITAAENGHVEVLRFFKVEFGLTANDARTEDNDALKMAAYNGHVEVLRFLKDKFDLTANDARAEDNDALRWAAEKGHVEVLRFLKDEFGLTAQDARDYDNDALRSAAANGHLEVLRFLKDDFGLTADDARARNNEALRWATLNGHEKVIEFFEKEWGLSLS